MTENLIIKTIKNNYYMYANGMTDIYINLFTQVSEDMHDIINTLNFGEYIGIGGSAIVYNYDENNVVKLVNGKYCSNVFDLVQIYGIPSKLLHVNTKGPGYIYIQQKINNVCEKSPISLINILEINKQIINTGYIIPDINYLHFTKFNNEYKIYDFHDIRQIDDIVLEALFYNFIREYAHESTIIETLNIESLITFITASQLQIAETNDIMCNEINSYQKFTIDYIGKIKLYGSTKNKFDVIEQTINLINTSSFTFVDLGCCFGIFGLKIGQLYNGASGDLINMTQSEIDKGMNIQRNIGTHTVKFHNTNIMSINEQYDCVICMSVIHHLLSNVSIDDILQHLQNMTKQVAIIELPIYGDVLLTHWLNSTHNKSNYECLQNMDTIKNLISNYFTIVTFGTLEYNTDELNRVYFIVKKN
jgi:hypothetical protein